MCIRDRVRIVVREATAAFVHTCNVHSPAPGHITRDLHVADEGRLSAYHDRAVPCGTVITGEGNEDVRVASIKVVPGNIHPPEERRRWVVVRPTRLTIVTGATVVNARIMGPA